jgi:hypothetical protein
MRISGYRVVEGKKVREEQGVEFWCDWCEGEINEGAPLYIVTREGIPRHSCEGCIGKARSGEVKPRKLE